MTGVIEMTPNAEFTSLNSVLLNFSNVDAWRTWAVGILSFKRSGRKFIISDGWLIKAASNPLKVAGNPPVIRLIQKELKSGHWRVLKSECKSTAGDN